MECFKNTRIRKINCHVSGFEKSLAQLHDNQKKIRKKLDGIFTKPIIITALDLDKYSKKK